VQDLPGTPASGDRPLHQPLAPRVDKALAPSWVAGGSVVAPGPSWELFVSLRGGGSLKKIIAVSSGAGL